MQKGITHFSTNIAVGTLFALCLHTMAQYNLLRIYLFFHQLLFLAATWNCKFAKKARLYVTLNTGKLFRIGKYANIQTIFSAIVVDYFFSLDFLIRWETNMVPEVSGNPFNRFSFVVLFVFLNWNQFLIGATVGKVSHAFENISFCECWNYFPSNYENSHLVSPKLIIIIDVKSCFFFSSLFWFVQNCPINEQWSQ